MKKILTILSLSILAISATLVSVGSIDNTIKKAKAASVDYTDSNYVQYQWATETVPLNDEVDYTKTYAKIVGFDSDSFTDQQGEDSTISINFPSTIENKDVIEISESAFFDNQHINSVNIPGSIKDIKLWAFYQDFSLTNIKLNEGTETIGASAFSQDNIQNDLYIPSSVISIGDYAFDCNHYKNLTFGKNSKLETIPYAGFHWGDLEKVTLPSSTETIGYYAFGLNKLTSVTIPNNVKSIDGNAFHYNQIKTLNLGNSVTYINYSAFAHNSLTNLSIPGSVKSIDEGAFYANSLTALKLGEGVKNIYDDAFAGTATVDPGSSTGTLQNRITSLTIPSSVRYIGNRAFAYNALKSLTIKYGTTSIGSGAFRGSTLTLGTYGTNTVQSNQIQNLIIPSSVANISVNSFAYNQINKLTLSEGTASINDRAFAYNKLKSVKFPSTISYLSGFNNNEITSISLSNGLEVTGTNAFRNNKLSSVTIPNSTRTISTSAFENNQINKLSLNKSLSFIGNNAFRNNQIKYLDIPSNLSGIGTYAFQNNNIELLDFSSATNLHYVNAGNFSDNSLTSVNLGNAIEYIGDSAFSNNHIKNLDLGRSVIAIGHYSFENNNISNLVIPSTTETIGQYAFYNNHISNLNIKGSATILSNAFNGNSINKPWTGTPLDISNVVSIQKQGVSIIPDVYSDTGNLSYIDSKFYVSDFLDNQYAGSLLSENSISYQAYFALIDNSIPVSSLQITPSIATISRNSKIGGQIITNDQGQVIETKNSDYLQLAIHTIPTNATFTYVDWESSDTNIATVDSAGLVTAQLTPSTSTIAKTVTITARSPLDDSILATSVIKVVPQIPTINHEFSASTYTIVKGKTKQVSVKWFPSNATNKTVNYSSSNQYIAGVNNNGLIKANNIGTTTIFGYSNDDSQNPFIKTVVVNANNTKLAIKGKYKVGQKLTAKVSKQPSKATIKYQWLRNGKAISKATKSTYKLVKADKKKKISLKIIVSKNDYETKTISSKAILAK